VVEDELDWLAAWRAGDEVAGAHLFRRHFAGVHRFFRNKIGAEADDLTQRTFLACLEGRAGMRGDGSFRSWLFAIARNQLLMLWRRRGIDVDDGALERLSSVDVVPFPAAPAMHRQERDVVLAALRGIPVAYQIALELFYWEDMSTAEIGAVLELSDSAIKSRLARGRELLRARLEQVVDSRALLESTLGALDKWAREAAAAGAVQPPEPSTR
jgi:RNA polymerase sigma factor (sigma-70 family)